MPMSDLEKQYSDEYVSFSVADQTNLTATAGSRVTGAVLLAPFTGYLKELTAGYLTEAGATPSLNVSVERSTTALATAAPNTAATPVGSGEVSAFVSKGEVLGVKVYSLGNADNDFTGISGWIRFRRALSTD